MPLFVKCLTFTGTGAAQRGSEPFCLSGKACAPLKPAWLSPIASRVRRRCKHRELRVLREHLQRPWDELPSDSWKSHLIPSCLSLPPQKMDRLFRSQALQNTEHTCGAGSPEEPGFDLIWGSEEPL